MNFFFSTLFLVLLSSALKSINYVLIDLAKACATRVSSIPGRLIFT